MSTRQEVYHSTTLGPIPLSFTGRHLLATLREAITAMVDDLKSQLPLPSYGPQRAPKLDWEPVSEARGKLAQYMSKLEKGAGCKDEGCPQYGTPHECVDMNALLRKYTDAQLVSELQRRLRTRDLGDCPEHAHGYTKNGYPR